MHDRVGYVASDTHDLANRLPACKCRLGEQAVTSKVLILNYRYLPVITLSFNSYFTELLSSHAHEGFLLTLSMLQPCRVRANPFARDRQFGTRVHPTRLLQLLMPSRGGCQPRVTAVVKEEKTGLQCIWA